MLDIMLDMYLIEYGVFHLFELCISVLVLPTQNCRAAVGIHLC